ncbi:MAG TPA: sulfotransferase [Chitinophagales bacterium]|nr:sulfotransferase [Chitinophagales bacterium]
MKPNFFIVGAPKSGTTSLYFYLKSHPQIFLPRRKELLFFCDDLHFTYPILNERQFLDYYRETRDQQVAGEVSVWNLYSRNAAQNIFQFNPDSKIIIILRHPVDMLYALHSNHVFNDNETITDFENALNAEADRKQGQQISSAIKCPVEGLYYSEVAAYSGQVQRYYDIFGKEKVKVILFDDFISDTKKVYADLLHFLSVDETVLPHGNGDSPEFKIFNANKTTRSEPLKRLTIAPPQWMKVMGRKIFPHQSKRRDLLMQWLWKVNTKEEERKRIDPQLRKKLISQFTPEILNLEKVIDRDLSRWRQ